MWLDWLNFCDYGFSVSALWCPLTTLTVLLGFLLRWTWSISSQLLQQSVATVLYLGWEVSFQKAAPPDFECEVAPLGPPAPMQPPLLGRGVAPLSHRSWHWECGLTAIKILHKASLLGGLLLNICHLLFGASDFSTLSIIFSHFESNCLVTQDMVLVQTNTKKKVVKWCPQWPHTGRVIRD